MANRPQGNRPTTYVDQCTVYIRFPVPAQELDEQALKRLFGQFGGLSNLRIRPEQNYGFAMYEKPIYALYVCEMLNGIRFLNSRLIVKPRENTDNARMWERSPWSRAFDRPPPPPTYYNQLPRINFEDFDPEMFLQPTRDG